MHKFLIVGIVFFLLFSCTKQEINHKIILYVGTSNGNPEKGIEMCYFDTVSGEISSAGLSAKILNPNYLSIDLESNLLFSVGKLPIDTNSHPVPIVTGYSIHPISGELSQLSTESTYGNDPCYVAYNSSTQNLFVANYSSGNVSNYVVDNGHIKYKNSVQHYGHGPNESRQKAPHAHSIDFNTPDDFIYAADLGADKLMVYKAAEEGLQVMDSVICHPGAGPRHFDFSPNGQMMAVLNELDCSVSIFEKDTNGVFKNELNTLPMLPDTFSGFSKAADIHFSPDGAFLYASNRGFNSLAIYKVTGTQIEFVQWETQGINWPRNFTLDPTGNFILVANRDSDNITVYKRDIDSGLLTKLPFTTEVDKPVCLKFYN